MHCSYNIDDGSINDVRIRKLNSEEINKLKTTQYTYGQYTILYNMHPSIIPNVPFSTTINPLFTRWKTFQAEKLTKEKSPAGIVVSFHNYRAPEL